MDIPPGVTTIGNLAFSHCRKLTSISIASTVASIGSMPFYNCNLLTDITVDSANAHYSSLNGVLYNKPQTLLVAYPPGKVGSYSIPAGVAGIGTRAFHSSNELTSLNIPPGLDSISSTAFTNCDSLISFVVDAGNTTYSSADGILFNKSQTSLLCYPGGKTGPFNIPEAITSLGQHAFEGCIGLTEVTIPDGITIIPEFLFMDCYNLASVDIPESVTSIGGKAFSTCLALTNVTIPSGVTSIGNFAFENCTSLTSLDVDPANEVYSSVDGVVYDKLQTILRIYPPAKAGHYTILPGVDSIASYSFYFSKNLTGVTVPASVTSIGNFCFYSSSSLASMYFQGNAPSLGGSSVFSSVPNLTVYYLPHTTGWTFTYGGYPTSPLTIPLKIFQLSHYLPQDGSQDLSTPAGDGVPNLYKFAFNMIGNGPGQSPSLDMPNSQRLTPSGSAGLPLVDYLTGDENRLKWTYIRRKASTTPGITYLVEFADDLTSNSWADNPSAQESVTSIDAQFERVTLTDDVTNASKRFSRIRILVP